MDLYYAPGSVARATFITLEEVGAEFRAVRVDFANEGQNSKSYRKINPKGRVPALVTNEGILTETPAMLVYVAQLFPKAKLAPFDDLFAFAQVQSFNSYIASTLHVAHAHKHRGARWADEEASMQDMRSKVSQTVGECFAYIENDIFVGPNVMGETYTICDPYLFTVSGWMESDGVDINAYPKIRAHREQMEKRDAVQRALKREAGRGEK